MCRCAKRSEPLLAVYGAGAEATVYTDPNGALIKCRRFGEVLTEQLLRRTSTVVVSTKQIDRIAALASAGVLQADPVAALHLIRKAGTTRPTATSSTRAWPSTFCGHAGI